MPEEQGQSHRPGEEEVHARVAAGSAACGVAEAYCQGAGVFRAGDRIVARAAGRAEDHQLVSWQLLIAQERQHVAGDGRGDLDRDRDVVALPEVVLGDYRRDRRGVGRVGCPEDAALHDGDIGVRDHPQCSADRECRRLAEAAGDRDMGRRAEVGGDRLDVGLQLLPGGGGFGRRFA